MRLIDADDLKHVIREELTANQAIDIEIFSGDVMDIIDSMPTIVETIEK